MAARLMPGVRSPICRRLSAAIRQGKPKPEIDPAKSPSRGHLTLPESVVLTYPVSHLVSIYSLIIFFIMECIQIKKI